MAPTCLVINAARPPVEAHALVVVDICGASAIAPHAPTVNSKENTKKTRIDMRLNCKNEKTSRMICKGSIITTIRGNHETRRD